MQKIHLFPILLLILLLTSCKFQKDKKPNELGAIIENISSEISKSIKNDLPYKGDSLVEYLSNNGCYQLAFSLIKDSLAARPNNKLKLKGGKLMFDHGYFELGKKFLKDFKPNDSSEYIDYLNLMIFESLETENIALSNFLKDSLKKCLNWKGISNKQKFETLLNIGFHYHNLFSYDTALDYYSKAEKMMNWIQDDVELLSKLYRRIGNTFNNLSKAPNLKHKLSPVSFSRCLENYKKELDFLKQDPIRFRYRIALTYLTTGYLYMNRGDINESMRYFDSALAKSIFTNENGYFITTNYIYVSIVLTFYSNVLIYYQSYKYLNKIDSLIAVNQSLIDQSVFTPADFEQNIEFKKYGWQTTLQQSIDAYIFSDQVKGNELKMLSRSTFSKYPYIELQATILRNLGKYSDEFMRLWVFSNEYLYISKVCKKQGMIAQSRKFIDILKPYIDKIKAKQHDRTISQSELQLIKNYCKKNNACIIEYANTTTYEVTFYIDENGIQVNSKKYFHPDTLDDKLIGKLKLYAKSNQIKEYEKLGYYIYSKLFNNIKLKPNVIICPVNFISLISFDCLVTKINNAKKWTDVSFLADDHNIRYLPNLLFLLSESENRIPFPSISLLYSSKDNKELPYNKVLIDYIKDNFKYKIIKSEQLDSTSILHILAHTKKKGDKYEFYLDNDTITSDFYRITNPFVILQGCATQIGYILFSEGTYSLSRAFFYGGSKTVISSFWEADNQSSVEFFKKLYESIDQNKSLSQSFKIAQIYLKKNSEYLDWNNPYYWGSWCLTGNEILFTK